ncbi:hypothetical protein HDV00_007484 [Rhizophlyctis rosea]|nr:hypothetical protein HDV00_007484 [Rhizophlyctis rosea]
MSTHDYPLDTQIQMVTYRLKNDAQYQRNPIAFWNQAADAKLFGDKSATSLANKCAQIGKTLCGKLVSSTDGSLVAMELEKDALKNARDDARAEADGLGKKLEEMERDLDVARDERDDARDEVGKLVKKTKEMERELGLKADQLVGYGREIDSCKEEIGKKDEIIRDLRQKTLEGNLEMIQGNIEAIMANVRTIALDASSYQHSLEDAHCRNAELLKQLREATMANAKLQEDLNVANEIVRNARAALGM